MSTEDTLLLHFDDEREEALRLARAAGLQAVEIERHRFPDDELRLRLPAELPANAVLFRSLHRPNEKLLELLLVARSAGRGGACHLTLVAPYLAYMRQDKAFHPGEVVSQRIVGEFLAGLFDGVITVDPHLHRISSLAEAIPVPHAVALSGAGLLADVAVAALIDQDWVLTMRSEGQDPLFIDLLAPHGIAPPPHRVHYARSALVAISMLDVGDMLTICPWPLLETPLLRGRVQALPIRQPLPTMRTSIVTRRNDTLNAAGQMFIDCFDDASRACSTDPSAAALSAAC